MSPLHLGQARMSSSSGLMAMMVSFCAELVLAELIFAIWAVGGQFVSDGGSAVAGQNLHQADRAAIGFDDFPAHHLIEAIIGALDQDVRPERADQIQGRVLIEENHHVHIREGT
ncbi:hypothetical protein DESC_810199 [Desulfosarcina cetonica]|nr:hypothetical protein DESC_810199 [Desulfosarcina cetonica]